MSARRSPVEQDARKLAADDLRITRHYRDDEPRLAVLKSSASDLARGAARAVLRGDMPDARRYARAHQLIDESATRLSARHTLERVAKQAREAARHGITAGDVVRVVRARTGTQVPDGQEATIDEVRGDILYTTIAGERRILWAPDVERVEPDPELPQGESPSDVIPGAGAPDVDEVEGTGVGSTDAPPPAGLLEEVKRDAAAKASTIADLFGVPARLVGVPPVLVVETARNEWGEYECLEPGCDFIFGATGPLDPDEPDHFADQVAAHLLVHEPTGALTGELGLEVDLDAPVPYVPVPYIEDYVGESRTDINPPTGGAR